MYTYIKHDFELTQKPLILLYILLKSY